MFLATQRVTFQIKFARNESTGSQLIKSFTHKGLERFFFYDDRSGIKQDHVNKLVRILDRLDTSVNPRDMNLPGYRLHQLKSKNKDLWSVWISGTWRLVFQFKGQDAVNVDYLDYH